MVEATRWRATGGGGGERSNNKVSWANRPGGESGVNVSHNEEAWAHERLNEVRITMERCREGKTGFPEQLPVDSLHQEV